ncbi:hypothetical protein D7030_09000 [Flavobacteriaceae bacterium AU392]|nr:hypothetical protein D1817_15005 [Flavobacteriaceae bacterium]RKM84152.1 hypothetical protein D7030_09000 [Flavobacteriaceae bacterium AU392]
MFLYLLKSSFCLAIFLAFYKLFLEKENIHFFKRFYLLTAIVLAFSIPLITFTTYIEPIAVTPLELDTTITFNNTTTDALVQSSSNNYWSVILWSIYALGVILFGIKFIKNLFSLIHKIKRNPKYKKTSDITNVLLKDDVTPHTFLRYIFFNKHKFETQKIPQEVFWHEETHAKQKHSIDVLIIEFLQVIFWFNPLIYFTKRAIKLNHEFLADQGVLNKGIVLSTYQQIVLAFSSSGTSSELSSAINYSSIKKRFTIMKTKTSKGAIWLRSLVLLPLLALTLYSFSNKIEIENDLLKGNKTDQTQNKLIEENILNKAENLKDNFLIYINHKGQYIVNREALTLQSIKNKISALSKKELNLRVKYSSPVKNIEDVVELLKNIKDLKVNSTIYHQVTEDIQTKKANEINELLETIGNLKVVSINIPTPKMPVDFIINDKIKKTLNQDKATPKQIAEYNKLAKYYNSQNPNNIVFKYKDLNRVYKLYNLMSEVQKKNAEPLPNFPPPPPPLRPSEKNSKKYASKPLKGIPLPKLPKNPTQQEKKAYNKALEEYKNQGYGYTYTYKNNNGKIVDATVITSDVAPPPPPARKRPPPPPPQIIKENKNEPNPPKVPEPPQIIEVREIKKSSKLPEVIEVREVKKDSKLPEVIEVKEVKKNSKLPEVIEIKVIKKNQKKLQSEQVIEQKLVLAEKNAKFNEKQKITELKNIAQKQRKERLSKEQQKEKEDALTEERLKVVEGNLNRVVKGKQTKTVEGKQKYLEEKVKKDALSKKRLKVVEGRLNRVVKGKQTKTVEGKQKYLEEKVKAQKKERLSEKVIKAYEEKAKKEKN